LGCHVRFGWEHAHFPGFHPQRVQKLPHLGRLAGNPGEGFDPGRRFRHRRGWALPKLRVDRRTMGVEGTPRLTWLEVLQLLDPPGDIRLEITVEAGFGNAAQPWELPRGDPLTAQVEGFHPPLDPWVGMLKAPILQSFDVSCAKRDLEHCRAPCARMVLNRTRPTLEQDAQKVSIKPV
jgi:hypothetical protein